MIVIGIAYEKIEVGQRVAYDPETGHVRRALQADMTKDAPKPFIINELLMHPDSGQLLNFIRNEADGFCRCRSENGQTGLWRPETLVRVPRETIPVAKEFASNRPCDMMGHDFTSIEAKQSKWCTRCHWPMDLWKDCPDHRSACQGKPLPSIAFPLPSEPAKDHDFRLVPVYTCQTCQRIVTTTLNGACLACRQATMKEPPPSGEPTDACIATSTAPELLAGLPDAKTVKHVIETVASMIGDAACPNHWTGGLTGVCPDCGKK